MAAGDTPQIDTSAVDPENFARSIGQQSDEQLRQAMGGELRGLILDEIFKRMGEHFDSEKGKHLQAVVHWRISGRPDGGSDQYALVVENGNCTVDKGGGREPRLALEIDGVDFLRLVTGHVAGPALFMSGKLKLEGDVMFAATLTPLFRIPGQPEGGAGPMPGAPPSPPPAAA